MHRDEKNESKRLQTPQCPNQEVEELDLYLEQARWFRVVFNHETSARHNPPATNLQSRGLGESTGCSVHARFPRRRRVAVWLD